MATTTTMDNNNRVNNHHQLGQLCVLLETTLSGTTSVDQLEQDLARLLQAGECGQARILLDAAEMRLGPWLLPSSGTQDIGARKTQLGATHLLVLLCEDALPEARMLTKRLGAEPQQFPYLIQGCFEIYQRLWSGNAVGAIEVGARAKSDPQLAQFPLALKALEHFEARLRARQLVLVRRAYTAITVGGFGNALGLGSMAEVDAFCNWSPNLYQVTDGFVLPAPPKSVENEDVTAQIEKLTRLIVFLEGETVTYINSKAPTSSAAGTGGASSTSSHHQ